MKNVFFELCPKEKIEELSKELENLVGANIELFVAAKFKKVHA